MSAAVSLGDSAAAALEQMRARGFDHAQVTASASRQDELNIADSEPSLMRTTEAYRLALTGIVGGRKAATELAELGGSAVREAIDELLAAAASAPRDDANTVSSGQAAKIVKGPQEADIELLTEKAHELLDFFHTDAPKVTVRESVVAHALARSHTVTSGGSRLEAQVGHHSMGVFGMARDGAKVSGFAYSGGTCHDIDRHAAEYFGMAQMLRDLEKHLDTRPVGDKFVGDVILTPTAVADFVSWFLGQLCDVQLIAASSLYRDRVGEAVGSPLLTLRSRFDAPGVNPFTDDAFVASPVEILRQGVLTTLTPSLYGSRKTGLAHVPTAAAGWEVVAGDQARDDLIAQTPRGALVGRLSMGRPASNGEFSGVIKSSFAINDGKLGSALSETMISGNVARMLLDVTGVSRERIDTGAFLLPWVRISNLHFS